MKINFLKVTPQKFLKKIFAEVMFIYIIFIYVIFISYPSKIKDLHYNFLSLSLLYQSIKIFIQIKNNSLMNFFKVS